MEIAPTSNRLAQGSSHVEKPSDRGSRRKVAKGIIEVANFFGNAADDQFDDSEFKQGKAGDFPEIPGEENRNRALMQIREKYNQRRDTGRSVSPMPRSRAESFTGSVRAAPRSASPVPSIAMPRRRQDRSSSEPQYASIAESADLRGRRPAQRRETLEVPSPVQYSYFRHDPSPSPIIVPSPETPNSPTIVVSSDPDAPRPTSG